MATPEKEVFNGEKACSACVGENTPAEQLSNMEKQVAPPCSRPLIQEAGALFTSSVARFRLPVTPSFSQADGVSHFTRDLVR